MPYSYKYAVSHQPSNNDYGHEEKSDGDVVTGSYYVLLPDGRRQVVTYRVDHRGYTADVKYEPASKAYPQTAAEYPRPYYQSYPRHSQPAAYPRPDYQALPEPGAQVPVTDPTSEQANEEPLSLDEPSTEQDPTPEQVTEQVLSLDEPSTEPATESDVQDPTTEAIPDELVPEEPTTESSYQ